MSIIKRNLFTNLAVVAFLGVANTVVAQEGKVGINTETPNATLDITAKVTDGSRIEGLKTPQLTGDALKAMTTQLTADNDGLVVFVTSAVTTPDASTEAVTLPGYYRFNFATQPSISVSQGKSFYTAKSWVRLEPTGLEIVKEGGKIGRRLVGTNPERYANIGTAAIDLSFQNNGTTDGGASGNYSVATGVGTKATGANSFAGGQNNQSTGKNAVAIVGYNNTASGENSFAGGNTSTASSVNSFAFGHTAKANSEAAVAFGRNVEVKGVDSKSSFAVGQQNVIDSSPNSFVFGVNSSISNSQNSFAGGAGSSVKGNSSIALGNGVKTTGNGSFAAGSVVSVNGEGSIALGFSTKVGEEAIPANQSIAIGAEAHTKAINSVALGNRATVNTGHDNSVAIGKDVTTTTKDQVVIGGDTTFVSLGRLQDENSETIIAGGTCTSGRIVYNKGSFYGCANSVWKKLDN